MIKELAFECCFCGEGITSSKTDPCDLNVLINIDKPKSEQYNQTFYCHLTCFKKLVTPKVPIYLETLLGEE